VSAFATLPAEERELFFRQYQERRGVDPVIAEKDFWVCWLLGGSSSNQTCRHEPLQGWHFAVQGLHVIERFSEDIDLGITGIAGWKESDLDEAPSRTKRDERMPT